MELIETINEGAYSIYKNKNTRLVNEIRKFKTNKLFYFTGIKREEYVIKNKINQDEYLCELLNSSKSLIRTEDEIACDSIDTHLMFVNSLFKVSDYFTENFGIIKSKGIIINNIIDLKKYNENFNFYVDGVSPILFNETYSKDKYGDIFIEINHSMQYSNFHIYFNLDGNYVIRNYNMPILDELHISFKQFLENCFKEILSIGDLEYINNFWFNEEYVYYIDDIYESYQSYSRNKISIKTIKKRDYGNGYQNNIGENIIKKPKKTTRVNSEHLLENFKSRIKKLELKFDFY